MKPPKWSGESGFWFRSFVYRNQGQASYVFNLSQDKFTYFSPKNIKQHTAKWLFCPEANQWTTNLMFFVYVL